jgi:tRNA A37 N6-isopentenylltransferase MiaA
VSDSNTNTASLASSLSFPEVSLPECWAEGDARSVPAKNEGWPDFPFFWIEKPNMSSLQDIASRLKEKVESARRSGFIGETTPMEKQIIDHLSSLQQQVLEVHDAVQASLQIIDNQRLSQRAKRAQRWIREKTNSCWHKVEKSVPYRVLAVVGALLTLWLILSVAVRQLHLFK